MQEDLIERAKHNKENTSKAKIFGLIGYACLAVCIVFSILGKWTWAGAFGAGLVVFSFLEGRFDKKRVDNDLLDSLKVKESNFKNLK